MTPAKDPLAYKVYQLPGGTIAGFDGWRVAPVMADATTIICDTAPAGREQDFVLRVAIATPNARDLSNLFTVAPQLTGQFLQQISPTFRRTGEPRRTKVASDEALVEAYEGTAMGKAVTARALYVRREDVGIGIVGIGTEQGFKEFGRSIEIVAQSITFKQSPLEAGLIGTWRAETYSSAGSGVRGDVIDVSCARSITLFPNGTFTDSATTGVSGPTVGGLVDGGCRGKVVRRGNVLTFHYDDGKTWSAAYELYSNGLKLDGVIYLKQ